MSKKRLIQRIQVNDEFNGEGGQISWFAARFGGDSGKIQSGHPL
jgi:hypothetical protein